MQVPLYWRCEKSAMYALVIQSGTWSSGKVCFLAYAWLHQARNTILWPPTLMLVHAFVVARVGYCNMVLARWCTEVCHWQTAAGIERCCTSCQRNAQVRPWTVAAATCWLAPARCGRSSSVQAHRHSPPVSPKQGSKVPDSLLCRCLGYRWSSATALSTPSPAGCTVRCYPWTTLGRRAFSVAGPTIWNSLPDELREETENTFRLSLKTSFFRQY